MKDEYLNYTAHPVSFIRKLDTLFYQEVRKHVISTVGYEPVLVLPSIGQLNAKFNKVTLFQDDLLTVVKNEVVSVDPLPEGWQYLIVSQMYAAACRQMGMDTSRLLCVDEPVYASADGKSPVGVLQLQQVA